MIADNATVWGKARQDAAATATFHPLTAHALDVAAVAVLLAPRSSAALDARTLGFLVALHDIGKISRPFQAKVPALWPESVLGPFPTVVPPGPAHDAVGWFLLRRARAGLLPDWSAMHGNLLWGALAGHHGRPPVTEDRMPATVVCERCHAAADDFVATMREVFRPPPCAPSRSDRAAMRLAWRLAGLTTLADWVGSRQAWFPYVTVAAVADPAGYFWNHAVPQATRALAAAGLAGAAAAPFGGLHRLFPGITLASPVQHWAETVALPDGPLLAVIEDLTGSGKTEAAMTLAHRLLAAGRAQGVYVGLPTMATANAMYDRMAQAYERLFVREARPSLALAHGRAELNPRFQAAFASDATEQTGGVTDPADEPAEAHCTRWLAQDGRRALLAHVGVGTLDQALLAALPVRHATLRLHGLAGKVLIVDEAHAFDAYVHEELKALLRFQAALGGSAILLSATLPRATRQALADAFRDGADAAPAPLASRAYPLATLVAKDAVSETECAIRPELARRVIVTRLDDVAAALERIATAAGTGAAIAWVRNTVDDAIDAAAELRARGLEPLLFHARFAMSDRLAIEAEVLRCFGRHSRGEQRSRVLVATQIVEQSLDIDFDMLCTDLAPADLLIQRAGRLWRHPDRQRPVPAPELLVVSPEPVAEPRADWIGLTVYRDPALLWRSARAVFGRGAISTPDDMRALIEEAANRENTPAALAAASDRAYGKARAQGGIGAQNALDVWRGYDRHQGLWDSEERTPTRLEDRPQMTLRLARLRAGVLTPYADDRDPQRAWALSEVTVARFHIAACPIPPGLEAAADEARQTWAQWERDSDRLLLAVLTEQDGGYRIDARNEATAGVTVTYSSRAGLSVSGNGARDRERPC